MSEQHDPLFREAVTAIKAGDKAAGRDKLQQFIRQNPNHEQAWLWMSSVVDTNEQRIQCLQRVLAINPNNDAARKALNKLTGAAPAAPPAAPAVPIEPPQPADSLPERETASLLDRAEDRYEAEPPRSVTAKSANQADESWRKSLCENAPSPDASGKSSARARQLPDDEPVGDRNLLDLMDAWVAAIRFDGKNGFLAELPVASYGRWFFGILIAALLASLTQVFSVLLQLSASGMSIESIQRDFWEPAVQQGTLDPNQIQVFATSTALLVIVIALFFGTIIGLSITQLLTHIAAGFLGGKGAMVETMHMMSIAEVAARIVALIPIILGSFIPGAAAILNILMFLYTVALNVVALTYVHAEFGIGKAILSMIIASILPFLFICCLVAAIVFSASGG